MALNLSISPLPEAVALQSNRALFGTAMTSEELEGLPAEVRLRSMFAARVEDERILAQMQERLLDRIQLAKAGGRAMDRGVFIEEMRDELKALGYRRGKAKRGSLQDLKSTRRLSLIFDMNVAQAQGYARWTSDMDEGSLVAEPCYELVRGKTRMEPRDWPRVWQYVGGKFYGEPSADYPLAPGRMIALKTDPIWVRISRFEVPWPPFDWGSGMVLMGVSRGEAINLGVLQSNKVISPKKQEFNFKVKASAKGLPERSRKAILQSLLGDVVLVDDELSIAAPPPPRKYPNIIPFALLTLIPAAGALLDAMSELQKNALLGALKMTVSYQRLKASGQELSDEAVLKRAMAQYVARRDGNRSVERVRLSDDRDLLWSEMDFAAAREIIETMERRTA